MVGPGGEHGELGPDGPLGPKGEKGQGGEYGLTGEKGLRVSKFYLFLNYLCIFIFRRGSIILRAFTSNQID